MAKRKPFDMGEFLPNKHEIKARIWCIRNKIFIAPKAIQEGQWALTIENKGVINEDPKYYGKVAIWQKIYQYYKHDYKNYENKV